MFSSLICALNLKLYTYFNEGSHILSYFCKHQFSAGLFVLVEWLLFTTASA